ncbi:MAG TPA: LysR substrate-binding domain-containing protein [Azospira sp.]|nr:LysR substrate-binding domain-containing protein [Azospira sp.]
MLAPGGGGDRCDALLQQPGQGNLALAGEGIVCLADFMTRADRTAGTLVEVLAPFTLPVFQPINAVYYRNTQLAARISCFLDYLGEALPQRL